MECSKTFLTNQFIERALESFKLAVSKPSMEAHQSKLDSPAGAGTAQRARTCLNLKFCPYRCIGLYGGDPARIP